MKIRSNILIKVIAALLAISCATVAGLGWVYSAMNWDSMFAGGDYTDSSAYYQQVHQKERDLTVFLDAKQRQDLGVGQSYSDQQELKNQASEFSPDHTNFRYIARDNATGEILYSTMGENSMASVAAVWRSVQPFSTAADYTTNGSGIHTFYDENGNVLSAESVAFRELSVEYGVDSTLPVNDIFLQIKENYTPGNVGVLWVALSTTFAALALCIYLCCAAGHRKSRAGAACNMLDRIPLELYLAGTVGGGILSFCGMVETARSLFHYYPTRGTELGDSYWAVPLVLMILFVAITATLWLGAVLSTATRCKTHTLWRNTLVWRVCAWIGRGCGRIGSWWRATFGSWSMTRRAIVLFALYLLGSLLTTLSMFIIIGVVLVPLYQGFVLWLLCKYVKEWRAVRAGTEAIVGGHPDAEVDVSGMKWFPDLQEHAAQLNDLGGAINSAVDQRMKSERMKAELITNVSHDLKTPLTSIINYVDLLKKEDVENDTAREYIEVLDRKSQRLKKLTEDLVEASKASTGALPVNAERLGVVQLVSQALGEYTEKFALATLTPVVSLPEEEVYVNADGRHFWRILDNLLGNCVKYAMPATRVYLDVTPWNGNVVLTVKNISAAPLNVAPDQLMERFVRGDESRTTEGSGLGLSIARSLVELQHGQFNLDVDGDLFKATVSFPEAKGEA